MKIVFLFETFAKDMGYLENMLPRYMARLGLDVHVLTTDLMPYYQFSSLNSTYEDFYKERRLKPGSVEPYDGYTLHVLPHERRLGYVRLKGMTRKLAELRPDHVYSAAAIGWLALEAGLWKPVFGYRLFTGSHTHASVFPLAQGDGATRRSAWLKNFFTRWLTGRLTSLNTKKCYAISTDCADIAVRFFGVQRRKVEVCSLGVDTNVFFPPVSPAHFKERDRLRAELGFTDQDIVCIYTGRFSEEKNPKLLAEAVQQLRAHGEPFKAVFIGHGVQSESMSRSGCQVVTFKPVNELAKYYRMADIGVWPTQESTSMLDAAACGLPLIVNDTVLATERIDGNGLTYRLNDIDDMIRALLVLKDPVTRRKMSITGSEKMKSDFSWQALAERRLKDFRAV